MRVLDEASGLLVARAVAPGGSEEAAELSGSRVAPGSTRPGSFVAPAFADGSVIGEIELVGSGDGLDEAARGLAELAAAQLAVALRTLPRPESLRPSTADRGARLALLEREGRTLAAGAELEHAARRAMQLAAESVGAARLRSGSASTSGSSSSPRWGPGRRRSSSRRAARPGARSESWEPALVEDADDGRRRARVDPDRATARRRPAAPLHRAAGRGGARRPRDVRRTRGACREPRRERAGARVRARADTRPALGGRRRDHPPLARAHARDGGRADRRAAHDRAGRDLPPRGPPARRGGTRARRRARGGGGGAPRAGARPAAAARDDRGAPGERRSDARAVRGGARSGPCRRPPLRCRCASTTRRSGCSSPTRARRRHDADDRALLARPCRPARRRRPERAPARAGDGARRGARVGARVGAPGGATAAGALRDLELLHEQPLPRHDVAGDHADDRRGARRRRGRDQGARRAG